MNAFIGSWVLIAITAASMSTGDAKPRNPATMFGRKWRRGKQYIRTYQDGDLPKTFNGAPFNGAPFNGAPFNGAPFNGSPFVNKTLLDTV